MTRAGVLDRLGGRIIEGYYLATPVFFVVDLLFEAPVRVAGLAMPGWRYAYYGALVLLGIVCRARPRVAPAVGMAESATNLLLLLLSILLPIWSAGEALATDEIIVPGLTQAGVWNVAIAGSMAVISFKRNERSLYSMLRRDRPGSLPSGR